MEPLTKTAFAARLKVSKPRISQLIAQGMPVLPDGRIDVPSAVTWIEQHVDGSHHDSLPRRVAAGNAAAPEGAGVFQDAVPPRAPAPPVSEMPPLAAAHGSLPDPGRILLSAKAKRALVDLRKAEREERRATGELIEIAEFTMIVESLVTNAKVRLLSIGSRIGPRLAVERDAARCTEMVDDAIRDALAELVDYQVAAA